MIIALFVSLGESLYDVKPKCRIRGGAQIMDVQQDVVDSYYSSLLPVITSEPPTVTTSYDWNIQISTSYPQPTSTSVADFYQYLPLSYLDGQLLPPIFPAGYGPGTLDDGSLLAHNIERNNVGVPLLVWDMQLAQDSLAYAQILAAEGCKLVHSEGAQRNGAEGENLAMDASYPDAPTATMGDMVQQFLFGPGEVLDNDPNNLNHHTQVNWRTTTNVGCAKAQGSYIFFFQTWVCEVMVCRYSPPGNFVGQLWNNPVN